MPKTLRTETGPGPSSQGKIRPNSLFQIPPPIRAWSSRRLKPAVTGWAPLSLHCPQPSPGRWDTGDPRVSNPAGVGGCLGREHPDGPHMEHLSSICWGDLSVRPSLAALKRNMRQRRAGRSVMSAVSIPSTAPWKRQKALLSAKDHYSACRHSLSKP